MLKPRRIRGASSLLRAYCCLAAFFCVLLAPLAAHAFCDTGPCYPVWFSVALIVVPTLLAIVIVAVVAAAFYFLCSLMFGCIYGLHQRGRDKTTDKEVSARN